MKLGIRILFTLNLLIELVAPMVLLFLLQYIQGPDLPFGILTWFIWMVLYVIYLPVTLFANRRRFPRTYSKAVLVVFVPLVIEATFLFTFLSQVTHYNGPQTMATVLLLHYFAAMLIVCVMELVQSARVKVFSVPKFIQAGWILFASFFVLQFSIMGVVVTIAARDSDGAVAASWVEVTSIILVWVIFGLLIAFVKYHRAGRRLYAKKGYRPNAAVIVTDGAGNVLLCERADRPGTIQTVQGGIDPGETPEQAAIREMEEELGLMPNQFTLRAMLLDSKAYEWDPTVQRELKKTGYVGQQQYFFLAEIDHTVSFDLDYHYREFRKVWWGVPEQLLRLSWSKKRPGIEAALKGFGLL